MSDDFKIQLNFKTPKGTLINLRANNGAELDGQIEYLASRLAVIFAAEQELTTTGTVAAGMPLAPPNQQPAQPVPTPPAAVAQITNPWAQPQTQPAPATWGAPQTAAPLPAPSQPVPFPQPQGVPSPGMSGAAPSPAQNPGHVCKHGMPAKYVPAGVNKAGKAFRAFWACPLDRDSQCDFRANA